MNRHGVLHIAILLLSVFLTNGCIAYTESTVVQMELPAIHEGEEIIRYIVNDSTIQKPAYTVSYDVLNKQPHWVAYELTSSELAGKNSRKGKNFRPDDNANVPQADYNDYRNSGWTKGHLAPAADFKWSDEAMNYTFYFTNCSPQAEYFNQISWERLEKRVRDWANQFGKVYVVTGPIIGDAVNGRIGLNRITVPDAFFKAVLTHDEESYHAIGFILENSSVPQPYTSCCVTIDDIERITGLDLYHNLDDAIESAVESQYDTRFWGM